jgi:hypothetical protein
VNESELLDVKKEWLDYYLTNNIDIKDIKKMGIYWWDREVLGYFQRYGTRVFKKLDIWDVDWKRLADHFRHESAKTNNDPRSFMDKLVHEWLKSGAYKSPSVLNRILLKLLRISRW